MQELPPYTLESVLAVEGEDYCIYLADSRELSDEGAGDPISGKIVLDLPPGPYQVSCFSPVTGLYSPAFRLVGGSDVGLDLPAFQHDLVVREWGQILTFDFSPEGRGGAAGAGTTDGGPRIPVAD